MLNQASTQPNVYRDPTASVIERLPLSTAISDAEIESVANQTGDYLATIEGIGTAEIGRRHRLRNKIRNVGRKVLNTARRGTQVIKRRAQQAGRAVSKGATRAWQTAKRYNPLSVTARNAYLLLLKLNVRGWASRLYLGLMPEEQARKQGYTSQQIAQNRAAYQRVSDRWANDFGGDRNALRRAVEQGAKRKPFLAGIGEAVSVTTALASAAAIIGALAPLMGQFFSKKGEGNEPAEASDAITQSGKDTWKTDSTASDSNVDQTDDHKNISGKNNNTTPIILGGAALLGLLVMSSSTKSKRR